MSISLKLLNYLKNRDRGWILSLLAVVCLLYLPFLGSPLVFDDLLFFLGGAARHYAESGFSLSLRWLPYASLGWTEVLFSNVVTHFFHLGNLLLHAANVILQFYLLRQLTEAVLGKHENASAVIWGAWLGAMMFALHPVAVYATAYVVQRSILMATCFALITQLAYIRGLLSGKPVWLVLAVVAYFLAVFSKEHSALTLALLAAQTLLLRGSVKAKRASLWITWGAFCAVALLIILRARGVFGTPYEAMAAAMFEHQGLVESTPILHVLSVLTQAGLFFKYLLLWLLPNPAWMSVDMREPFVAALGAWQSWLGVIGFLAYGYASLCLLLRDGVKGLIGLALLYPWLQFVLEFSSIRVQEPFVLYRSYLWMPGMLLVIPLLLAKWPDRKVMFTVGMAALLLAPLAVNRLWVFADNYRLWDDAARLLPDERIAGADRIFYNRGQAAMGKGMLDEAIADFQRSLAVSPQYAPVHFELGWALALKGRNQDAMDEYDAAIKQDPSFANAYYGKAMLLKMRHEDNQAAEYMEKSCELKNELACLIVKGHIER